MGLLQLSKKILLNRKLPQTLIITGVGGFISRRFFIQARAKWEKITSENLEMVLDFITPYDVARGAGKLLQGWLLFNHPKMSLAEAEKHLKILLSEMDQKDETLQERARSRLLVSKALFYLEGFRVKSCCYEKYQREARELLRKLPQWKTIENKTVFQAIPFNAEELIGTTHRMLLILSNEKLPDYIAHILSAQQPQSDLEYMVRLIALTFGVQDEQNFGAFMLQWLQDYRDFKLQQSQKQEQQMNQVLSIINGDFPKRMAFGLFKKLLFRNK